MSKERLFSRPIDGALFLFNRGFKVFPCKQNNKEPAFPGWQEWAVTATAKKIQDYGTANPMNNWGVACGINMLAVLDVDTKPEKDGRKTLLEFEKLHGALPQTFTVVTPSGGKHHYFIGECKNSVGQIGKGLDTPLLGFSSGDRSHTL